MKKILILIYFIAFASMGFSQVDLMPAYTDEVRGDGFSGNLVYFMPVNKSFTGVLYEKRILDNIQHRRC